MNAAGWPMRGLVTLLLAAAACAQEQTPRADADAVRARYAAAAGLIARSDYAGAVRELDALLALDPGFALAYRGRAYAACELGRYTEAERDLRRFMAEHGRERADSHALLGRILAGLGRREEAVASLERARALNPRTEGVHLSLGKLNLDLGRHAAAVEALETGLGAEPSRLREACRAGLADALSAQAEALATAGQDREALAALNRLAALVPGREDVLRRRAWFCERLGEDLDAAVRDVDRLIANKPEDAPLRMLQARLLRRAGRLREAADSLAAAQRLAPETPGLAALLGHVRYELGDFTQAAQFYAAARRLDPRDSVLARRLGIACYRLDRIAESERALTDAVTLDPADEHAHFYLAQLNIRLGRIERALEHVRRWASFLDSTTALRLLETTEIFQLLYNYSQYRQLVAELKTRPAAPPPAGAGATENSTE